MPTEHIQYYFTTMQRCTLGLVLLAVSVAASLTTPPQEAAARHSDLETSIPITVGESVVTAQLNLKPRVAERRQSVEEIKEIRDVKELKQPRQPNSIEDAQHEHQQQQQQQQHPKQQQQQQEQQPKQPKQQQQQQPQQQHTKEKGKSEHIAEYPYYENDYSLLPDKMPDLADNEYLEIGEDATPFDYLKQRDHKRHVGKSSSPRPVTVAATNPIYITVPIYINTGGSLPLTLSVGGQEVPLNPAQHLPVKEADTPKDLSPTSQFNRLPHYEEGQKLTSLRPITNRHRSSFHGKMYARKQHKVVPKFRRLGSYGFYL